MTSHIEQPIDSDLHLHDFDENENEQGPHEKRQRIVDGINKDVEQMDALTPAFSVDFLTDEERRVSDMYKTMAERFLKTCESIAAQKSTLMQQRQSSQTCGIEENKKHFPWLDTTHWSDAHKDLFKKAFGNKLKLTETQKGWVKIIATEDENNPNIGCKICQEHYELNKERYKFDPKNLNDFAQENGASYPRTSIQEKIPFWRKKIWSHEHPYAHSKTDMGSHPRIIMQLTSIHTQKKSSSLMEAEKLLTSEKLNTLKMFRTAYLLVKKNIPFDLFPDLVRLQQQNGALPDNIMHANRRSLGRIVETTALSLNSSIIETIKTAKPPLSIIVDSSTDKQSRQYLLTYLQFSYSLKQQCVLYRVSLLESETAQSMLELLINAFKKDKIDTVVKENLVAFVADGAAVMQGNKGGLGLLLEQWANWAAVETPAQHLRTRSIHKIHCSAHRLQLAVSHVVTKDGVINKFQVNFEAIINGIHSFYHRNSPKRRASLDIYAATWEVKIHHLKSIFKVRWLSSQYAAINSLHRNYFIILYHLQQIKESVDFDENTKQRATGYYNKLCTIDFYLYLIFQMDMLKPLSEFSETLQTDFYTLPYLYDDLEKTVKQLKEMEQENEFHLHHFLFDAICKKDGLIIPCTVEDVENDDVEVSLKMESFFPKTMPEAKFTFQRARKNKFKLSTFRSRVIPKLVESLNDYFPFDKQFLQKLTYLNPEKLPTGTGTVPQYAFQLNLVFEKFGSPVTQATTEMVDLMNYLLLHDKANYFKMKQEKMVKFWIYALTTVKEHRQIGEIQILIEKIFAIPPGSVIIERGFSVFFHSKNPRRSRLSLHSLQNIMTVLINGPAPQAFDPQPAVNLWIERKHKFSDAVPHDPNTGLLPAPLLPPERFVSDDTTEIFEFEDEPEESCPRVNTTNVPLRHSAADTELEKQVLDLAFPITIMANKKSFKFHLMDWKVSKVFPDVCAALNRHHCEKLCLLNGGHKIEFYNDDTSFKTLLPFSMNNKNSLELLICD